MAVSENRDCTVGRVSDKVCLHKAGGSVPDPVRGREGSEAVLQPAVPADRSAGLAGGDEDHAGHPGAGDSRTVHHLRL